MIFIDTNIFMYAAGSEHPNKSVSISFLEKIAKSHSSVLYCINTEVIQEIFYRYQKMNKFEVAATLFDAITNLPIEIKPITLQAMKHAKKILSKDVTVDCRDAVHAGMMMESEIETIVSFDSGFDRFEEINRVEP